MLPAHAISTKNKHLLVIYSIPTRGFTAAVSVFSPSTPRVARRSGLTLSLSKGFRGTPPAKPLICKFKIRLARPGGIVFRSWADPTGEASLLVLAKFNLSPEDIIKPRISSGCMSLCSCSQIVYHSLIVSVHVIQGKQKTLLTRGKQGEEILFRFVTCLHHVYPNYLRAVSR
jgi:hypothetical protein